MVTKVINIEVKDGDISELRAELKRLTKEFDDVDDGAKKASKSVDEVASNGGAIALLDELTGGLATRLKDSYEASKLFNLSLKGTKTALIATGIGAFVVALGAIVAYWDDIVGFINGANKELERQINIQNDITEQSERDLKILDQQDNILKLQGKSQNEINKLKKDSLKLVIQEQEESLKLAQQRLTELKEIQSGSASGLEAFFKTGFVLLESFGSFVDKIFSKLGLDTGFGTFVGEKSASVLESVFGTQDDIDEATQRVQELEDAILSSRNRLAGIRLSELEGTGDTAQVTSGGLLSKEQSDAELEKKSQRFEELFNLEALQKDSLIGLEEDFQAKLKKIDDDAFQYKLGLSDKEKEYRINTAHNVLNALSSIAEKVVLAQKAIAITQAIISTYQGINKALAETTDFTPSQTLRFANAAAVGIAGFANVANILKQKGGGGSSPSIGSTPVSAPSFNVVGTSGVNQLAESLQQDDATSTGLM